MTGDALRRHRASRRPVRRRGRRWSCLPSRPARPRRRGVLVFMLVAGAVVLLLVGATAGLALSGRLLGSADATPDSASVDAGFARDMIVHHDQGVLMAHYAEQNTTDPEIGVMAYDIGYTQTDQIGQMQGWLSLWDLPESGDGTAHGLDGRGRRQPRDDDGRVDRTGAPVRELPRARELPTRRCR